MKKNIQKLEKIIEINTLKITCQICVNNEKNTTLNPCGHTICGDCANSIEQTNAKCPICR